MPGDMECACVCLGAASWVAAGPRGGCELRGVQNERDPTVSGEDLS